MTRGEVYIIIKSDELLIRTMKETDYDQLTEWLNNEDVLEFYGDKNDPFDLKRVIEKYEPRVKGLTRVKVCIAEYKNEPVGFMQYYQLDSVQLKEFGYKESELVYGMDQLIGRSDLLGKGIGTRMVRALVNYIQNEQITTAIVMDPHIDNLRAIRCYEKCGFVKKMMIDKTYWLMEYKNEN